MAFYKANGFKLKAEKAVPTDAVEDVATDPDVCAVEEPRRSCRLPDIHILRSSRATSIALLKSLKFVFESSFTPK